MQKLNQENYYKDKTYLSNSTFKRYQLCQAQAYAIDTGKWEDDRDETALLVGNYIHSYFESQEAHAAFLESHADKLLAKTGKNKGGLKANYVIADKVIETLKNDGGFQGLYDGLENDQVEKEMILTGEIAGVPIKGKLDSINLSRGYFVDLKTMRSLTDKAWSQAFKQYVPAALNALMAYGYDMQMAIYKELLRQMTGQTFDAYIVAVSKETVPDKELIEIEAAYLDDALKRFEDRVSEVWAVIQGKQAPKACGQCDYCKSQKRLSVPIGINDLLARPVS